MRSSPDSTPVCSPDSLGPAGGSLDSLGPIPIGLGAAVDLFCAAKAAEGSSPRTVEWYRMIVIRAVRRFGEARPVDAVPAAELRAWLLELRGTLAPESIAGYVRGLKAFGNWCTAEELLLARLRAAMRGLAAVAVTPATPLLVGLVCLADEVCELGKGFFAQHLPQLRIGIPALLSHHVLRWRRQRHLLSR